MGLKKRVEFDHSQESVFEAAGYSEKTVAEELEPRARLLAKQLVQVVLVNPMMSIEVLLDSPVLNDNNLDSRDRAVIVMMAGHFLAEAALVHVGDEQMSRMNGTGIHGFTLREPPGHYGELKMSKMEWDTLVNHVERRVFGESQGKDSKHIERMEEVLDDDGLSPLQKAVVEILVLKNTTGESRGGTSPSFAASPFY
jgi:hypothetical protein